MTMTVLKPGSKAKIGEVEILIGAVRITGDPPRPDYEVIWWVGGDRKSAWVDYFEIDIPNLESEAMEVGFQ